MKKGPLFYAKVLLFGEYGIIRDSMGLTVPYNFYQGALKKKELESENGTSSSDSNIHLKKFVEYILELQNKKLLK